MRNVAKAVKCVCVWVFVSVCVITITITRMIHTALLISTAIHCILFVQSITMRIHASSSGVKNQFIYNFFCKSIPTCAVCLIQLPLHVWYMEYCRFQRWWIIGSVLYYHIPRLFFYFGIVGGPITCSKHMDAHVTIFQFLNIVSWMATITKIYQYWISTDWDLWAIPTMNIYFFFFLGIGALVITAHEMNYSKIVKSIYHG